MNLDPLIARAFRTVNAREANVQIATVRHEQAFGGEDALSYEVVAEPKWALEELADRVLPKLVYFLDCRGLRLPLAPGGIFVSLFVGDRLHFFHAGDFVDALAKVRGLDSEELLERWGADVGIDEENERAPADGSGAHALKLLPGP